MPVYIRLAIRLSGAIAGLYLTLSFAQDIGSSSVNTLLFFAFVVMTIAVALSVPAVFKGPVKVNRNSIAAQKKRLRDL